MPRRNGHIPAYRPRKPSGQARVIINHGRIYLGKFGSVQSRAKYARLIAEPAASPAKLHIYASGSHGFGLRPSGNPCSTWP
jgi:hypothetical protein